MRNVFMAIITKLTSRQKLFWCRFAFRLFASFPGESRFKRQFRQRKLSLQSQYQSDNTWGAGVFAQLWLKKFFILTADAGFHIVIKSSNLLLQRDLICQPAPIEIFHFFITIKSHVSTKLTQKGRERTTGGKECQQSRKWNNEAP